MSINVYFLNQIRNISIKFILNCPHEIGWTSNHFKKKKSIFEYRKSNLRPSYLVVRQANHSSDDISIYVIYIHCEITYQRINELLANLVLLNHAFGCDLFKFKRKADMLVPCSLPQ